MFARKSSFVLLSLLLWSSYWYPAAAQSYSLTGHVLDEANHVVASATVSAKSAATGKTFTAKTSSDGSYLIPDLAAGDYKVWAVAGDLQAPPIQVTLAAAQTTDLTVVPVSHHIAAAPCDPRSERLSCGRIPDAASCRPIATKHATTHPLAQDLRKALGETIG